MKLLLKYVITFLSLAGVSFGQQPFIASRSPSRSVESVPAATPPATQAEKAKVYFYRYKQNAGRLLAPSVYCDEEELARMENGRYFVVNLEPGKHTFRSNDKQSGVEVDLKPGQAYFLRVELVAGYLKGHGRVVTVAPEQARFELNTKILKPLDTDKVTDRKRVSIAQVTLEEQKDSK